MSDDFKPIRPKTVPLTRVDASRAGGSRANRRNFGTAAAVAASILLLVSVFVLAPKLLTPERTAGSTAMTATPAVPSPTDRAPATSTDSGSATDVAAPFAALERERARSTAQGALSRFVELQIRLEEQMNVGDWGAEALAGAKDLAASGDEAFMQEAYPEAVTRYEAAADALDALLATGGELLEAAVTRGTDALRIRDANAAISAFDEAAAIAKDDPRVIAGSTRAARLPEINEHLRAARNHELAGDWEAELASLEQVRALDPDTTDLPTMIAQAAAKTRQGKLSRAISTGFAQLEARRLSEARKAFESALAIDPGNTSALGGIEQVARQLERTRIDDFQSRIDTAVREERWAEVLDLADQALAVDQNLQFARSARTTAQAQKDALVALDKILETPEQLSSQRVYDDAATALEAARQLELKGPVLTARMVSVGRILDEYARPLSVILRSDNATRVTVSSVGVLGAFEEKRLSLRPGAYTLLGSRDGCRDVRTKIIVRPGMEPVDIRCIETL